MSMTGYSGQALELKVTIESLELEPNDQNVV